MMLFIMLRLPIAAKAPDIAPHGPFQPDFDLKDAKPLNGIAKLLK